MCEIKERERESFSFLPNTLEKMFGVISNNILTFAPFISILLQHTFFTGYVKERKRKREILERNE